MINSMTGYGAADGQLEGASYAVEIRAVNHRYFKAKLKMPEPLAFLEGDINQLLHKELGRGMITYVLRLRGASIGTLFDIDESVLRAYLESLSRIAASADIKCGVDVGGLLNLPGILGPASPDKEHNEQVKGVVKEVTQEAIKQLKQMRAAEGAALVADLQRHCKAIQDNVEQIESRSGIVVQDYQKKLRQRVDTLLANGKLSLDKETLAREVAIFAERSDISEEIARLRSHLEQFTQTCQADGQAGRRLDFISQEMLREANTIASKAVDTEIIHWVVDMKCVIDRIKEQVQNIE